MNMPLALLNRRRRGFTAFSPSTLFALAEPGVWFDPSDLTTLFQDPAGTTPVTAPGNTVGLMLDKSKGLVLGPELVDTANTAAAWAVYGTNTMVQDGDAVKVTFVDNANGAYLEMRALGGLSADLTIGKVYRLTFRARVNAGSVNVQSSLVGAFTDIATVASTTDTTVSLSTVVTSTSNNCFIRFGGMGAGEIIWISNISVRELAGNHATQAIIAARPTYSIEPVGGRRNLLLNTDTLATQSLTVAAVAHTLAFTGTGTVTLSGASIAGPLIGTGASNRVSLTFTPTAASLTLTVVGSVTLAQLELGSTATAYQKVTTQHDVTEAGVASLGYLYFDGASDNMVTSTITPGIDKVQVFTGVRKLTDATNSALIEMSSDVNANSGVIGVFNGFPLPGRYQFFSKGAAGVQAFFLAAAPITSVLTGLGDISGDTSTLRVNGTQVSQGTADQGTGNFLAYPLYLGGRGGTSLFFTGHLYSLITRFGPTLDAATIASTETWVAGKTGIVI